ncbi:hypothetical protein ABZS81_23610 [Streptomyces sp. NPDC005318]|uniref:hypothetical protein n=1 Tax=Streptomyces sp. NPDC005318 TaxID=3157031 RepID=UPI0033A1D379
MLFRSSRRCEESADRSGQTIVIITHDPAVAARAQRTLVMRDGVLDAGAKART